MATKNKAKRATKVKDDSPVAPNYWYLATLITVSCLLLVNQYLYDENNNNSSSGDDDSSQSVQSKSWSTFERPKPLLSYAQYRMMHPIEPRPSVIESSNRRMFFNLDLIQIGQVNSATLSGKQNYFLDQSPIKSDRTLEEQNQLNYLLYHKSTSAIADANNEETSAAGVATVSAGSGRSESPVSAPGDAELKTKDSTLKYLTKLLKKSPEFVLPSFPLDAQPDPERITHIDADLRDCTPDVRNQKDCGACYAFSWVAMAEWHYCKQTGKKIDLSEQYLVDCGGRAYLQGCVEGYLSDAKDFSLFFGMFSEEEYPYKARAKKCEHEHGNITISVREWSRLNWDRYEWEKVLEEQPIIVEMNLPTDFDSYGRGIHPGHNCDDNYKHGIIIVGHGRQDGIPYWLLKNSRGKKWGENGFFRIDRRAPIDKCFSNAYITKIKFKDVDEELFDEFYNSIEFKPTVIEYTEEEKAEMARRRAELADQRSSFGGKILGFFTSGKQ